MTLLFFIIKPIIDREEKKEQLAQKRCSEIIKNGKIVLINIEGSDDGYAFRCLRPNGKKERDIVYLRPKK